MIIVLITLKIMYLISLQCLNGVFEFQVLEDVTSILHYINVSILFYLGYISTIAGLYVHVTLAVTQGWKSAWLPRYYSNSTDDGELLI